MSQAIVTGYAPSELVGGIIQGDSRVILLAEDVAAGASRSRSRTAAPTTVWINGPTAHLQERRRQHPPRGQASCSPTTTGNGARLMPSGSSAAVRAAVAQPFAPEKRRLIVTAAAREAAQKAMLRTGPRPSAPGA